MLARHSATKRPDNKPERRELQTTTARRAWPLSGVSYTLAVLRNTGKAHGRARNETLGVGDELVEIVDRPVATLGLHRSREIEPVAALALVVADNAVEIGADLVLAVLIEGVASGALLCGGCALFDRSRLQQFLDRFGRSRGRFLGTAPSLLCGNRKARLFRHLRREQGACSKARHQEKKAGGQHGTDDLVEFEGVHF